jgi:peptidoglycan/LPS O-acetylase OafA/YrhL
MAVAVPGDRPDPTARVPEPSDREGTAGVPGGDAAGDTPPASLPAGVAAPTRLHWIDWLRVAAIAGVFVFHTFRPFDADGWHVKNAETSAMLGGLMTWFWSFGLALLFLLAGAGARFALRKRTWRTFVRERTTRLLVPFAAGTLLLSPIQSFIQATHEGRYSGSIVGYLGAWAAEVADALGKGPSPTIAGIGYHLWFLGFLFAISVVALPVCTWLMGRRGGDAIDALARRVGRPGTTLAFAIPIALLMGVSAPFGSHEHDWFEFGWYVGYFAIGFVLMSDQRFLAAIRRDLWIAFGVAVVSAVGLVVTDLEGWASTLGDRGLDWTYPAMGLLFATEGWAWTVVILGIGMRAARLQQPVGQTVGDAVLPVYVIHQPVILAVAFFVVQWPLGILPKWLVVFGVSAVITLALVELALRSPLTRILLGARARPGGPLVARPVPVVVGPPTVPPSAGAQHGRPR